MRFWSLIRLLPILGLAATPAAAGFNDLLQVICDEDNFVLTGCDVIDDGFRFVHAIAISADDKHVYTCSSLPDAAGEEPLQNETLSAFSRAVDGTLTLVDQEIEGSGGVTTLASCRGVAVSPDGKHVYTAALVDKAVTWFGRNSMSGALTFTAGDSVTDGGQGSELSGANAVAVSPDNQTVYVAGRSGDSVAVFGRNTTTGDLTWLENHIDGIGLVDGLNAPVDIDVSPDGENVYVAGVDDNAIAVFTRDTTALGELTFLEAHFDGVAGVDGLERASRIAIDPAGENVYVATERSFGDGDWIAVFARDGTTGALTFLERISSATLSVDIFCSGVGPTESGIGVSPDGLFVAVAEPFLGALATFSRSAADGTLTLVEAICDDILADDDDIGSIIQVALSADGKNLYAAGGAFSIASTIDYECDSPNADHVLSGEDVSTTEIETACRSITASDYTVLAAGDVTFRAPTIVIGNDFAVLGTFVVESAVP